MTEPKPVIDALHKILVHLEVEHRHYEETNDDKRHAHVYAHAAVVREWLASIIGKREPGLDIVIEPRDKT